MIAIGQSRAVTPLFATLFATTLCIAGISCVAAISCVSAVSLGQDVGPNDTATDSAIDTAIDSAIDTAHDPVQQAARSIVAGDYQRAAELLRTALAEDPSQLIGWCHLGTAQWKLGQRDEAYEAFRKCQRFAEQAQNIRLQGSALLGAAMVHTAQVSQVGQARSLWNELKQFAAKHPRILRADVARRMLTAIEKIEAQEDVYIEVRRRIEDRGVKTPIRTPSRESAEEATTPAQ